jgi:nucleoside-diphosphate-sugar epimerase
LFTEIARLLKISAKPEYVPPRPGDVIHSLADLHRAETLLGYRPKVDIKAGLKRVVTAFSS